MDGRRPDRLPFMPIIMMFASDHSGVRYYDYATNHRVLAQAQLAVAEAYDIDHVSCISDPAREAADCGAQVRFFESAPPCIDESCSLLAEKKELLSLREPDPAGGGWMHDRINAASLLRALVGRSRLVEGWVEGPCAEGADLRGISALMLDFYDDPGFVRDLFAFCVGNALRFARAQVEAGADLIGVGDAAASLVGPALYREFVWPFEKQLVDGLKQMGARVRLHICGNTGALLAEIGALGCDIVDLDSMVPLDAARRLMSPRQVLLGNMNPVEVLRNGTPEDVNAAVAACHQAAGNPYIIGAGCEIPRGTPAENLRVLARYAREAVV